MSLGLGGRVLYEVRLAAVSARLPDGAQQGGDGQLLGVGHADGRRPLGVHGELASLHGTAGRHLCAERASPRTGAGAAAVPRLQPPPLEHQLSPDLGTGQGGLLSDTASATEAPAEPGPGHGQGGLLSGTASATGAPAEPGPGDGTERVTVWYSLRHWSTS